MVERHHGIAAVAIVLHGRTVDHDDVQIPIVVTVDEAHAAAGGFDNIVLGSLRDVRNGKTSLPGDVFKLGKGWSLCNTTHWEKQEDTQRQDPHKAP